MIMGRLGEGCFQISGPDEEVLFSQVKCMYEREGRVVMERVEWMK